MDFEAAKRVLLRPEYRLWQNILRNSEDSDSDIGLIGLSCPFWSSKYSDLSELLWVLRIWHYDWLNFETLVDRDKWTSSNDYWLRRWLESKAPFDKRYGQNFVWDWSQRHHWVLQLEDRKVKACIILQSFLSDPRVFLEEEPNIISNCSWLKLASKYRWKK